MHQGKMIIETIKPDFVVYIKLLEASINAEDEKMFYTLSSEYLNDTLVFFTKFISKCYV